MHQGTSERGENTEDASTCMEGALKAKGCRTRGCGRNQPSKSQKLDTQNVSVEDWGFDRMLRTLTATYVQKQFCRNTCPVRNTDVAFANGGPYVGRSPVLAGEIGCRARNLRPNSQNHPGPKVFRTLSSIRLPGRWKNVRTRDARIAFNI